MRNGSRTTGSEPIQAVSAQSLYSGRGPGVASALLRLALEIALVPLTFAVQELLPSPTSRQECVFFPLNTDNWMFDRFGYLSSLDLDEDGVNFIGRLRVRP